MSDEPSVISARPLTKAQRRALYIYVSAQRQALEQSFTTACIRANKVLVRDCRANPTQEGVDRAVVAYTAFLAKAYRRFMLALMPLVSRLVSPPSKSMEFETKAISDRLRRWLDSYIANRITKVGDGTKAKVRRLYAENGADINRFETALQSNFSAKRATLIARTETSVAMNTAITEQAKEYSYGQKLEKTWVHSGMSNARSTHEDVDGVTIPEDDRFDVEDPYLHTIDHMRYPCDPMVNNPRNVCNCRCLCSYRFKWD